MTTVNPSSNINHQEEIDDSTQLVGTNNNRNSAHNGGKKSGKPSSEFDIKVATGIFQPRKISLLDISLHILNEFEKVLGVANIIADPRKNEHFRKAGAREKGPHLQSFFHKLSNSYGNVLKLPLLTISLL